MKNKLYKNKHFKIVVFIITIIFVVFLLNILKSKNIIEKYEEFKPRVVVTLTTSPKRINSLETVINSIMNQTVKPDLIYLNLPTVFKRNDTKFNMPLPSFITDNEKIYVNFCEDIGPATKIIPAVYKENDDETFLFSIDDDVFYPKDTLETHLYYSKIFDDCIINGTSFIINKNDKDNEWFNEIKKQKIQDFSGEISDLLEGFSGVLYKRKFFTSDFLNDFYKNLDNNGCKFGDDFYLSNLFKKHGRKVITLKKHVNHSGIIDDKYVSPLVYGFNNDALHKGGDGETGGNHPNYRTCTAHLESNNDLYIDYFKYN